jgi:hypothetical protein
MAVLTGIQNKFLTKALISVIMLKIENILFGFSMLLQLVDSFDFLSFFVMEILVNKILAAAKKNRTILVKDWDMVIKTVTEIV